MGTGLIGPGGNGRGSPAKGQHPESATLLERDLEVSELGDALTQAQQGGGRLVVIEAPAGLGKTSLLRAACQFADAAGVACLRARASELEHDFAYGCMRQLLEPVVGKATGRRKSALFEGAAALSKPLFDPADPQQAPTRSDSAFSMFHGLYWLLNNLTDDGPLAVVIDDLHWADVESLRFLNYLAPRLDGLPLAVFASARSGEDVSPDLVRLAAGPETIVLRPRPLSTGATVRLCERRLGAEVAPEFATACREATGGNPFLLEALLREIDEQGLSPDVREAARVREIGPQAVADAVLLHLSGRPTATALVHAVAVVGDGASLPEVALLAELSGEDAAGAADTLVALGILRSVEGLEFTHSIVREAVCAGIGAHERSQAHARAARILAAAGASDERVAAQIVGAEPAGDPQRVELLRRVAADALCRGAPAAAVAWLSRAIAEPPSEEAMAAVLLDLGSAELRIAAPEAVEHLAAAVELIDEPQPLATGARLLANALTWSGQSDRSIAALESAIALVEPADRELALHLEAELAAHAQEASRDARAPAARRLERFSGLEGATPGERLVLASLAFERARESETEREAAAHLERALAGGRLLDEQRIDVAPPIYVLLVGLLATEALELAEACVGRMVADARAQGSIPALAFATEFRGWVSLRRGAVADAEEDARTALELLTTVDIELGRDFALALMIETLIEEGDVEGAARALRSRGLGEPIPPGLAVNDLLEARGLLRLAQGDARGGLDDLIEFGRRDELWGGANPLASRWRSRAALALAALGDGEQARRLALEDLERARQWSAPSGMGIALRAVGLVEGGAAAVERLREATELLARSPARLEHARALVDLGAALRRANRRAEARGWLQEGFELARRCGASALAEHARTELRAAGGRSSQPAGTGVEQLTVSERRVAELAAAGNSNPEIAQALFVTRKTVETHLGRVYRKLGISGRDHLARALGEQIAAAGD
jgi:ATP/maltotriose-dependent transcriptional regulator MalT